jgi:hypothetical protein
MSHPMDIAQAEDRESNGLDFVCETCGKTFIVYHYMGQWDHAGEPICEDCEEKQS